MANEEKKAETTEAVGAEIAKADEAPEPGDCAKGTYLLAVAYTCTCGASVGIADTGTVQVALNNGAIRVKHDCGQWWFLTPKFQIKAQANGNGGGPNRQQRRTAAALGRTPGGILVPR